MAKFEVERQLAEYDRETMKVEVRGETLTIEAARVQVDAGGLLFFDEEGGVCAAIPAGHYQSVRRIGR